MSPAHADLLRTIGYLVADVKGRVVGTVEAPMYGSTPDVPDAISVRSGFLSRRRSLVPAAAISEIDTTSGVIGLSVDRDAVLSFLERLRAARRAARSRPSAVSCHPPSARTGEISILPYFPRERSSTDPSPSRSAGPGTRPIPCA